MEEAVRAADVIHDRNSKEQLHPILKTEWVKPNAFIASQGTADIPNDLFVSSRVVFDEIKMHRQWKEEEEAIPESQAAKRLGFPGSGVFRLCEEGKIDEASLGSLSEIAYGSKPGRNNENEVYSHHRWNACGRCAGALRYTEIGKMTSGKNSFSGEPHG